MAEREEISLRGILKEMRWIVALSIVLWLGLYAVDARGIRTRSDPAEMLAVGILAPVLMGPAAWLRYQAAEHGRSRRYWFAMTMALAWLLGGAVGLGLLADHYLS